MRSPIRLALIGTAALASYALQPAGSSRDTLLIEIVAGTGGHGFSGDGGKATEAQLNEPSGVATDNAGNVYIADNDNNRIRRVDREGRITTVAGTGEAGFSGDSGPATDARLAQFSTLDFVAVGPMGDIYVADYGEVAVESDGFRITVSDRGRSAPDEIRYESFLAGIEF